MKHAEQPQLCENCYARACARSDVAPPGHILLELCLCGGPDAVVMGMASRQNTEIVTWDLYGRMTAAEARARGEMILVHLQQKGMVVSTITLQ